MIYLDFYIPKEYRGKKIHVPKGLRFEPEEYIDLLIPNEAYYLDVDPLEFEEEFQGNQDDSDKQQLRYYDKDKKIISVTDLEHQVITSSLMWGLERLFKSNIKV